MAEEEVSASLIPPVTGADLSHWIAVTAGAMSVKNGNKSIANIPEPKKEEVLILESGDADDIPSRFRSSRFESMQSVVRKAVGPMLVGQTRYLKAANLHAARQLQRTLNALKQIDKWEYQSSIDKRTNILYIKRTA